MPILQSDQFFVASDRVDNKSMAWPVLWIGKNGRLIGDAVSSHEHICSLHLNGIDRVALKIVESCGEPFLLRHHEHFKLYPFDNKIVKR